MKVLLFGQHFAEYIVTLAGGFHNKAEVTVCISNNNFREEIPASFLPDIANLNKVLMPMPGPGSPWQFAKSVFLFYKCLRKQKPQVVHFQEMPKGFSFVCWLVAKKRIRVLTIHDVQSHPGADSVTSPRQEFIRNYIRKSANLLIVHGSELYDQLQSVHPEFIGKTRIVPHPAFRYPAGSAVSIAVDKELLFFGRISKYKGLSYLLEACKILQSRGRDFSLVIAGSGDDLEANQDRLKEIRQLTVINRRIEAEEIDGLFRSADIIVLPYIEASQSGVAAYALGFGKATVASRTGSIPEMIRDNFNGLLAAPADADDLANAIDRLLVNADLKRTFASNAGVLASTLYSPSIIAQSTLACYTELLNEPHN